MNRRLSSDVYSNQTAVPKPNHSTTLVYSPISVSFFCDNVYLCLKLIVPLSSILLALVLNRARRVDGGYSIKKKIEFDFFGPLLSVSSNRAT